MPWRERNAMDERVSLVVRALSGEGVSALSREFGVHRKTAHKWLRVYREEGRLSALEARSRRPHRSPRQTPERLEQRVVELHAEHGWGGRKLSHVLRREGVELAPATVDRILHRRGLTNRGERHRRATRRFERAHPNELWQMDHKAEYSLASGEKCVPLTILDDHSRYVLALDAQPSTGHEPTERSVRACLERHGVPRAMLMDHGVPWWSATSGHGLTRLSVMLIELGIEVIYSSVAHPQTQGKVERFHGALDRALRQRGVPPTRAAMGRELARFRSEYNDVRPHESLGMAVPAERYQVSPRPYRAHPEPWAYPPGSEVRRINSAGLLDLPAERYFVCHALAGKDVWCQRFGPKILVTYRHMHVREIDRRSGRTTSVVRPWYQPDL